MRLVASRHRPRELLNGPLEMELHFTVVKPLKPKFPELPCGRPDIEKLARFVCDCLEGVLYTNDARVVDMVLSKRYGNPPGCRIVIRTLERQGGLFDGDQGVCVLQGGVLADPAPET